MVDFFGNVASAYTYIMDDMADPRTKDQLFISRPNSVIIIIVIYLSFCLYIGPRFMKNRKAYKLKTLIKYYNISQILMSLFLMYEGLLYMLDKNYNLICDPVNDTDDPRVQRTATSAWWYFFAKFTELTETIIFVLRKKNKQISTLHLYHHTMVIFTSWLSVKYFPVGPIVLVGTLNSFVHALMYTYYFLSGLGAQYQKYLWWKKHMTLIQLIQFGIILAHNINALFYDCNYPKVIHIFLIINAGIITYMFGKFYYHSYVKVKSKKIEHPKQNSKVQDVIQTKRKSVSVGQ